MTIGVLVVPTASSSSSSLDLSLSSMDMSSSSIHLIAPPPAYSPSTAAPDYSVEPGPSEQRLALTVRPRPAPRGTVRRSHNGITVALRDQDESAEHPIYGRRGVVAGDVELSNAQNVTSVTATIEGCLDISITESAEKRWIFLSSSSTLWKADGSEPCPSILPLELAFPETYTDPADNRMRALPPTYDPAASAMRDIHTRIAYRLYLRVTKDKVAGLLWKPLARRSLTIPLDYIPRSRPHRPILSSPFPFLSAIKSLPEEWHHINVPMASTSPQLDGIDCNLFIPEVQIFGKEDSIPFFLQLRAPVKSMRQLFLPAQPTPTRRRPLSWQSDADASASGEEPKIRVYIKRQVTGCARGEKLARSYVIGEATLRAVPPGSSPGGCIPSNEVAVDYEGELPISPKVTVGGFNIGRLSVLDFLVLSITPCNRRAAAFEEVNHVHSIRIVTDSAYRSEL